MLYNNSYLTYINVLGKPKNTIYEKLNEIIMRVIISYNNRHLKYIKVFIKKSKIDTYQQLDTLIIDGLKKRKIDIILVDQVLVNKQSLRNVYIGVLDELDYDCLLNKEFSR